MMELEKVLAWCEQREQDYVTDCDWQPGDQFAHECLTMFRAITSALDAMLPEEREGACWCGWCFYRDRADNKRGWWCGDTGTAPCESYCPRCGAELCADGIARRHADTARVERVDSALKIACKSLAESDCADTLCIAGECPKVALVAPCPQEPVADCDDEYAAACWRLHFLGLADAALDAPQGGGTDE